MSRTFTEILPLALGAAVSPTILAIGILILAGQHGRLRMTLFTAANLTAMGLIAWFAIRGFDRVAASPSDAASHAASRTVDVVLGIVLLLLGIRRYFHDDGVKESKPEETDQGTHPLRYLGLGVLFTATNFTTLMLFLPALKEIAYAKLTSPDPAILALFLVVVATVTAWVPLLLTIVVPKTADRALGWVNNFTTVHRKAIEVTVLLVFGAYLLIKGLAAA